MANRLKKLHDRRFLPGRLPLLALSAVLITIGIAGAPFQPPRSDAFKPVRALSADWLLRPVERNAFARLASIGSGLSSVQFLADGERGSETCTIQDLPPHSR